MPSFLSLEDLLSRVSALVDSGGVFYVFVVDVVLTLTHLHDKAVSAVRGRRTDSDDNMWSGRIPPREKMKHSKRRIV